MQLENVLKSLFEKTANCDPDIIRTLDHAEHNIELDYRGRYILELLQNARDVAMLGNTQAQVKIILKEDQLWIANNGASFNEDGLRSICRIGLSSKKDISFIGHKGLGFKSVMEISERPEIITQYGTIYFDREKACEKLNNGFLKPKELPLLFLPMYKAATIEDYKETLTDAFTSLIILPYRKGILAERIKKDLTQITISSFPLLGYFEALTIIDETENNKNTTYTVTTPKENHCKITYDSKDPFRLRIFEHRFRITPEQYETLPEEERDSIDHNAPLEIKLALWLDQNGRFAPNDNLSLYLFYPLEEKSGFRFIIHSHFVVTPNRKGLLENSPLNRIILDELISYISSTFLSEIRREFPDQVQSILAFTLNSQNSLQKYGFYQKLIEAQKSLPLIWSHKHQRHLQISEILIATESQLRLFSDGIFADKILYKKEEDIIGAWMNGLLRVQELTGKIIQTHIEEYAEQQKEKGNVPFFQQLYTYCAQAQLNLSNKKILITEKNELLSSASEVYYGGQRTELKIPDELSKTITFLHSGIKIEKFRVIESFIGAVEFKAEHLVKRVLKFISENTEGLGSYLLILRDLRVEPKLASDILAGILLPIINSSIWMSPLFHPIYFHSEEIESHYPNALFVDLSLLTQIDNNFDAWRFFLESYNVWSAPAIYISATNLIKHPDHLKLLGVTNVLTVKNDVVFDLPVQFTPAIQKFILDKYTSYSLFISTIQNTWQFKKENRGELDPHRQSSFAYTIQNEKWLYPTNISGTPHKPSDVLILLTADEQQPQIKVLRKYVPIYFSSDNHSALFRITGAIQGRNLNSETAIRLFSWVRECQTSLPQEADFASAWNRFYGFFFDYWKSRGESDKISIVKQLKQIDLLGEDSHDGKKQWVWQKASSILYIDDKPLYDCLPIDVRKKLPPVFTKRDKNEIGSVLNRVGVVLSEKISRSLTQPTIKSETALVTYCEWFPYAIPIIEHRIGSHIPDNILRILASSTVALVEKLELEINITIEETNTFIQAIPFYLEKTDEARYRIYKSNVNTKSTPVIHELLEEVISEDFDIRLELQELSRTRNENEIYNVLNELNIDIERAKDVNNFFNAGEYSERLEFWNAFGKMFDLSPLDQEENILLHFESLANFTSLTTQDFAEYDKQLHLQDVWTSATLEIFRNIFTASNKSIEDFNSFSLRKIDISSHNHDLIYSLIIKWKPRFVKILFDLLRFELPERQMRFLDLIDEYHSMPINVQFNSFTFDSNITFAIHIEKILLKIENDPPKIEDDTSELNEVILFNQQRELLIKELKENNNEISAVDSYLEEREIKSLLCFDVHQVRDLILKSLRELPSDQSEEREKENSGINDLPIIDGQPRFPQLPTNFGNGSGRRSARFGGSGKSTPPSQSTLDEIGFLGEQYVFSKLSKTYKVEWISKNAERARKVITGDDTLGYDMRYVDENGTLIFIEVKATSGTSRQFNISRGEVAFGIENKGCYFVYFVINATSPTIAQATNLGNIFLKFNSIAEFELSEDFQVESNGYLILFDYDNHTFI